MAKPQLLIGAYDTGPSNYCRDVAVEGLKRNYGVVYLGNNPETSFKAMIYVLDEDRFDFRVIGGPSSFNNTLDRVILGHTSRRDTPALVLGDTPRSILRPGVKGLVHSAIAVVASPSDVEPAREFGYKDAVWVGYPSHWADPKKVKPANLNRSEYPWFLVYVSGLKHAEITDNMLATVLDGLAECGVKYTVVFQEHPSEIAETQNHERRSNLLHSKGVRVLATRESVPSLMMAADISVVTGGSTGVMEAALLRLPVLYYFDTMVERYMKKQVNEELWGPVAAGACEIVNPSTMGYVINDFIGADGRSKLRAKQEAAFPLQPEGVNTLDGIFKFLK